MDSVEEVLALKPSLVIGSVPYEQETVAKLLEQPINFLAMNPRSLADIENDIRLLGDIVGRSKEAGKVISLMKREFRRIEMGTKHYEHRLRVYSEAWPNPRISSPPWVAELVSLGGGKMCVPAGQRLTDEQVAEGQPEVIVLAWTATGSQAKTEKVYKVEAWKGVPAVRNRRVYVVRDELLNTPGPPLVEGARELARILAECRK